MAKVKTGGLLALDIAGVTGWAYGPASAAGKERSPPISGTMTVGWENCHDTQYFGSFDRWIDARLDLLKPTLVVFEAPILLPHDKLAVIRRLHGLIAVAEAACSRHGLSDVVYEVSNQQIKSHATGDRCAKKDEMVLAAECRGWIVDDHNEADALFLWDLVNTNWAIAKGAAH